MRIYTPGILAPALILALVLPGCHSGQASEPAAAAGAAAPLPVEVVSPRIADISATYESTGTLAAEAEAPIPARAAGEVVEILVEEGDAVRKGDVLARLDGDRARLAMLKAKADFERTAREHERQRNLHERGLVSKASFESLAFDVKALRAAYELASLDYEYTVVRTTIDGIVASRNIKIGSNLAEGDAAFVVTGIERLLAYLDIPQVELHKFATGHPAGVEVDFAPDDRFAAVVERISPTIDANTGTFRVTMAIDNRDGRLAPGMFGRFTIAWQTHEDAVVIPASAAVAEDQETIVFAIENGEAVRRPVTTGIRANGFVEIVDGLTPEDSIVLAGQSRLRDGARVVAKAAAAADSVSG